MYEESPVHGRKGAGRDHDDYAVHFLSRNGLVGVYPASIVGGIYSIRISKDKGTG